MNVDVRIWTVDLNDALRTYIERRLHFALGRFAGTLARVRVQVEGVVAAARGATDAPSNEIGGLARRVSFTRRPVPDGRMVEEGRSRQRTEEFVNSRTSLVNQGRRKNNGTSYDCGTHDDGSLFGILCVD